MCWIGGEKNKNTKLILQKRRNLIKPKSLSTRDFDQVLGFKDGSLG